MFLSREELQGVFRETDGKYRGGEMPLIKVICYLIGYGGVGRGGGLVFGKMTPQGQQRYEARCTATADNPPSSRGNYDGKMTNEIVVQGQA